VGQDYQLQQGHASSADPGREGSVPVSWTLTHLQPNTTYHFRLVATTGSGSTYYPLIPTFGRDLTFTTNATGRLLLVQNRLVIRKDFLTVRLRCLSGLPCIGRVTISTRARIANRRKFGTVLCATHFHNVKKQQTKGITIRVRGACLALLLHSPHHRHLAKLSSNPQTGQHAVIKTVVLVLG
jgi:hypothetical protein